MAIYGSTAMRYRNTRLMETIINEAYVGKSEFLTKIEEQFKKLKESGIKMTDDINTRPEIKEINRLFEQQFGCKLFSIKIDKSNQINAYTEVLAMNFKVAEEINVSTLVTATAKNGYYFKQPNDICIIMHMYYGLLTNDAFTPAELVAVCLHEIGHNFADCLYDKIKLANRSLMLGYKQYLKLAIAMNAVLALFGIGIPSLIKSIMDYKKYNMSFEDKYKYESRKRDRKENKLKGLITGFVGKGKDYIVYIDELITRSMHDGYSYERNMNKYLDSAEGKKRSEETKKTISRQNEVFADKFAGVYGYGVEQATALIKMQNCRTAADLKLDGDGNNEALNRAFLKNHNFDCHPQVIQRSISELKLYKRELEKDDMDPRIKKELLAQIKQLEELMEEASKTYDKLTKNEKAKHEYNKYIKDNDPDAVPQELEDAIEDSLDKLIEADKIKNKRR